MLYPRIQPIDVSGSPYERGRAIAAAGSAHRAMVVERTVSAAEPDEAEREWTEAQWHAQRQHLPEMCALIEGLAAGFGLTARQLFTRHVAYALEDRKLAAEGPDPEGCSAFVVRTDAGVLVAKNRDNPPSLKPLQTLIRQRDPAWARATLSIGSFGSAPSASSGVNSDGLCVADTSVRTTNLGIGVLRYYLMEAILYRCRNVAEALALIRALPHLGGGTLVLGDADGHIAVVEIGHDRVIVENDPQSGWLSRTNHFLDARLAATLTNPPGSEARRNSESRLAFVERRLAPGFAAWNAEDCVRVLSSRGEDGFAALCRDTPTVLTLSGAIFDASQRTLLQSVGRPSANVWQRSGFG